MPQAIPPEELGKPTEEDASMEDTVYDRDFDAMEVTSPPAAADASDMDTGAAAEAEEPVKEEKDAKEEKVKEDSEKSRTADRSESRPDEKGGDSAAKQVGAPRDRDIRLCVKKYKEIRAKKLRASLLKLVDGRAISKEKFSGLMESGILPKDQIRTGDIVIELGGRMVLKENLALPLTSHGRQELSKAEKEAKAERAKLDADRKKYRKQSVHDRLEKEPRPVVRPGSSQDKVAKADRTLNDVPAPGTSSKKPKAVRIKVQDQSGATGEAAKVASEAGQVPPKSKTSTKGKKPLAVLPDLTKPPPRLGSGSNTKGEFKIPRNTTPSKGPCSSTGSAGLDADADRNSKRDRSVSASTSNEGSKKKTKSARDLGFGQVDEVENRQARRDHGHSRSGGSSGARGATRMGAPPSAYPPLGVAMDLLVQQGESVIRYEPGVAGQQGTPFSSDYLQRCKAFSHRRDVPCPQCKFPHSTGSATQQALLVTDNPRLAHFYEGGKPPCRSEPTFSAYVEAQNSAWEHVEVVFLPKGLWGDIVTPVKLAMQGREGIFMVLIQIGGSAAASGVKKLSIAERVKELANSVLRTPVRWRGRELPASVAEHQLAPLSIPIIPENLTLPASSRGILTEPDMDSEGVPLGELHAKAVAGNVLRYIPPINKEIRSLWCARNRGFVFPPDLQDRGLDYKSATVVMHQEEVPITCQVWACEPFHLTGSQDLPWEVMWKYMISLHEYVRDVMYDDHVVARMDNFR